MNTRINTPPLFTGTGLVRPAGSQPSTRAKDESLKKYAPPHRAQFNYIPAPDVLKNMIDRALEALSKGVYWDRGSIINLVL